MSLEGSGSRMQCRYLIISIRSGHLTLISPLCNSVNVTVNEVDGLLSARGLFAKANPAFQSRGRELS